MDMVVKFLFILPSNITKEWFQGYRPTMECVKIYNGTVGYPKITSNKVYVLIVIMFGQLYILIDVSLSPSIGKREKLVCRYLVKRILRKKKCSLVLGINSAVQDVARY